jgi:predicted DNA-binding transcriptional regulator AlpA
MTTNSLCTKPPSPIFGNAQPNPLPEVGVALFRGIDERSGKPRLIYNGERALFSGLCYGLNGTKIANFVPSMATPFLVSPGYDARFPVGAHIAVLSIKREALFYFVGDVEFVKPKAPEVHSTQLHAKKSSVGSGVSHDARQRYADELSNVLAMQALGTDPQVKLRFVEAYLCESRSTIYRKIKLGLIPPPIKRGSASFWSFDALCRYRQGSGANTYRHST